MKTSLKSGPDPEPRETRNFPDESGCSNQMK